MNIFFKAVLTAFVLLVVLPTGAMYFYFMYPIDSFCGDINENDKRDEIMIRARAKGFFPTGWQGTETIWIFNHNGGPMFRLACSVDFENGKVSKKEVVDAD